MLVIVAGLICLMDVLALTAREAVIVREHAWWGARETSFQQDPAAVNDLGLASVRLFITINGDQLAAHYRLRASSGGAFVHWALGAQHEESGNPLVNHLLGRISVAQFHYGLIGNRPVWFQLQFEAPLLQVNGNTAIVTISSVPLPLSLGQQSIVVATPIDKMPPPVTESLQVRDQSAAMQVLDVSGALRVSAQQDKEVFRRNGRAVITADLREPGPTWTAGLRAMGGRTVPLFGSLMLRLGKVFIYIVLLWGLAGAALTLPGNRVVAVGRNVVTVIVGGFLALAVLDLCYQGIFDLVGGQLKGPALAGPAGLAAGGVLVLWPVACWRVTPDDPTAAPQTQNAPRDSWLALSGLALIAIPYLIILYAWLNASPVTPWKVIPSTAGIVILVYLLTNAILNRQDRKGPAPFLATAAMLAAVLATTLIWPVLVYTGFRSGPQPNSALQVNVLGKWTYLAAVAITVLGLCMLTFRFIGVACASRISYLRRQREATGASGEATPSPTRVRWRWRAAGLLIAAITLVAIGPPLVDQAGVRDPHAPGLVPASLTSYSGLYRALPELLNWLLLGLAITVLLSISWAWQNPFEDTDRRATIRGIAIGVMMLLLYAVYSTDTWLYIPVTLIIGLIILAWGVLPRSLASAGQTNPPARAITLTRAAWRDAEFADSQRQKLLSNADDLRALLIKDDTEAYNRALEAVTDAQGQLATRSDDCQREAHTHLNEAFDHRGEQPDPQLAAKGAIAGALLGVIPATVLLLTKHPVPSQNGYPVLDFLSYTGWILFIWPALGWSIGYFLPIIRGRNGIEKALWVFTAAAAPLPMHLLWFDGHQWATALIFYLELFVFLVVVGVILCDLMALHSAGLPVTSWTQVHNWKFLVTWSTALLAAIGTAAVTFLSTAATDFGQAATNAVTGQGPAQSSSPHG